MSQILGISELGNEILRTKANEVENISSPGIQSLIDNMIATVNDALGVGIAAPQVYQSERIFIIKSAPNSRYPYAPEIGPVAVINPKILTYSEEKVTDWEGCLSIPGIRALVPRYKTIEVEYYTRDNKYHKQEFSDFVARIFQHEHDHLNGILFTDRLKSNKDIVTEKEFQKIIQP